MPHIPACRSVPPKNNRMTVTDGHRFAVYFRRSADKARQRINSRLRESVSRIFKNGDPPDCSGTVDIKFKVNRGLDALPLRKWRVADFGENFLGNNRYVRDLVLRQKLFFLSGKRSGRGVLRGVGAGGIRRHGDVGRGCSGGGAAAGFAGLASNFRRLTNASLYSEGGAVLSVNAPLTASSPMIAA